MSYKVSWLFFIFHLEGLGLFHSHSPNSCRIPVHDLEFAPSLDIIINETLPALQQIKESGKARFIGITGYPLNVLRYLWHSALFFLSFLLT